MPGRWVLTALAVATLVASTPAAPGQGPPEAASTQSPVPAALTATARPSIPAQPSQIWYVPDRPARPASKALADFANGIRLFDQAKYREALPLVSAPALASTPLASYAKYYAGLVNLNLGHAAEARTTFAALHAAQVPGYLSEASIAREAEAAEAQGDHSGAAKLYGELVRLRTAAPDSILLALGRAQEANGDREHAAETLARLYYGYPFSDLGAVAGMELEGLKDLAQAGDPKARYTLDLARAEQLFNGRRYQAARPAFEALRPLATGDDAELVGLRLAECDHYLRRFRQALEELSPYVEHASRQAEARFFHLTATREAGDQDEYVRLARELIDQYPDSSWAEEALNNLATHYILVDDDEQADVIFRELYAKFPKGHHAERAAWKAGWWAYKHGRYQETTIFYENAAATFPRSDYRPMYLYWSARAREQAGDKQGAATVYRIVRGDYLNSYYGRLASKRLQAAGVTPATDGDGGGSVRSPEDPAAAPPPTVDLIRTLLSLELYDPARDELLYAQRNFSDTPAVGATLAWVYNRQGDLRRGIVTMKRAYPSYMAGESSRLPADVLRVVFPIDYWQAIKRYAPARDLDPFLVAALINQESAFDAGVKSSANAIGLMQVLPSTGRRWARTLNVRRYGTASLTRPEVNIQIGTAIFAELVRRFGGVHYALACYNAGENRVAVWAAERPGLELDEFIDDIPFPETQAYVKKIIGSVDDYRRLYGDEAGSAAASATARQKPATPQTTKKPPATKTKRTTKKAAPPKTAAGKKGTGQ